MNDLLVLTAMLDERLTLPPLACGKPAPPLPSAPPTPSANRNGREVS
jgi:hypothetical protein